MDTAWRSTDQEVGVRVPPGACCRTSARAVLAVRARRPSDARVPSCLPQYSDVFRGARCVGGNVSHHDPQQRETLIRPSGTQRLSLRQLAWPAVQRRLEPCSPQRRLSHWMREHRSLGPKLPGIRFSTWCRGRRRKPPLDGSPVGGRHHLLEHDQHGSGRPLPPLEARLHRPWSGRGVPVSRKSPWPPLNSGWGKHDAGSGADATTTIDDESHCHVTPALIAHFDRLRLGCHAEFWTAERRLILLSLHGRPTRK